MEPAEARRPLGHNGPDGLGDRIRDAREALRWTRTDLASKAGAIEAQVYRWERGANPAAVNLLALADALGVSVDWLLGRTEVREVAR